MHCFQDKTFCCKNHCIEYDNGCIYGMSPAVQEESYKSGTPVCYADFSDTCGKYKEYTEYAGIEYTR